MFTAKPKLNNHQDTQTFESLMDAVQYLNKYNEMGSEYEGDNSVAKLQAEDWWLLGKLTGPEGVEFKNNKVVEPK